MTEQDIRGLIVTNNFINAWFIALPNYSTYEAAYESIEVIYVEYFGKRRYSDYNSFRTVKNRSIKTKR